MQLDKFRARRAVKDAKQSGTSVKRFDERSSACKVFASGDRLDAARSVRELSDRLRCLRNLHFDAGRMFSERRLEELLFRDGALNECSLEFELPEAERLTFPLPRMWRYDEPCLELEGRVGDVLLVLECGRALDGMTSVSLRRYKLLRGLALWPSLVSTTGEPGAERVRTISLCRRVGLGGGHAGVGEC